jgi:hypothetical protein
MPLCATGLATRPRTPRLVSTSNHTKPELEHMVRVTLVPEMRLDNHRRKQRRWTGMAPNWASGVDAGDIVTACSPVVGVEIGFCSWIPVVQSYLDCGHVRILYLDSSHRSVWLLSVVSSILDQYCNSLGNFD